MNLKNYLSFGTKESMMRFAVLVAMCCIVFVVLDVCTVAILGIVLDKELDKVSQVIGALAGVIGTLSTIILYKAVQSFSENNGKNKFNAPENTEEK